MGNRALAVLLSLVITLTYMPAIAFAGSEDGGTDGNTTVESEELQEPETPSQEPAADPDEPDGNGVASEPSEAPEAPPTRGGDTQAEGSDEEKGQSLSNEDSDPVPENNVESGTPTRGGDSSGVAKIGDTTYTDLQSAFDAGGEITLLTDVSDIESQLKISKDVTLDLSGHSISGTVDDMIKVTAGSLTINDTSDGHDGSISTTNCTTINFGGSKLTINNGTVSAVTADMYGGAQTIYVTAGDVEVNGGKVLGESTSAYASARAIHIEKSDSDLTVNGGTIEAKCAASYGYAYALEYTTKSSGTVEIKGGTVNATTGGSRAPVIVNSKSKNTNVAVSGGTFNTAIPLEQCAEGFIPKDNGDGTFSVKEGWKVTFDSDGGSEVVAQAVENGAKASKPSDPTKDNCVFDGWFAEGSNTAFDFNTAITEDTALKAHWKSNVAKIGDTTYTDLQSAFDAGGEITLLTDVSDIESQLTISKDVTLDLNGHSISSMNVRALWIKNGNVEITGNGTISASGEALDVSSSVIRVGDGATNANKAKLTVGKDVTVSTDKCYGITVFGRNDSDNDLTTSDIELVLNGKVAVTGENPAVSGNGNSFLSATTVTIGKDAVVTATQSYAIYHPDRGTLTVNGTVEGVGGIEIKSGKLVVGSSAKITATGTPEYAGPNNDGESTKGYAIASVANGGYTEIPAVELNGGTINGQVTSVSEKEATGYGEVTATSDSVAIPEGYEWLKEGNRYVLQTPLDVYKADTIAALEEIKVEDYIDAQQYRVYRLIEKAKSDVANAGSIEDVDSIMDQFRTDLAEYTTLKAAKDHAKTELENYKKDVEFVDAEAYASIVSDGKDAIDAAKTSEAVNEALAEAKSKIDALKTKDVSDKEAAKEALEDAVAAAEALEEAEYTAETWAALAAAVKEANDVLGDDEATKRQYVNAKEAVEDAIEALVKQSDADAPAEINGTKYASLDAAIAAAEAGDTVKLIKDIDLSATVVISKDVTIDLNGHDVTATDARALQIKNGNVEITGNGTISASGEALDASSSVIRVGDGATNANKAKLTVGKDVVVSTDKCYGITVFGRNDTDSDLTTSDIELVLNGKVAVTGVNPAVSGNGNSFLSATTVTIGKDAVVTASQTYAIYHPDRGTLTVNGTVEGVGGIEIKSGKLVVGSSAKITATGTPEYAGPNNDGESTKGYAIASVANGGYTEIPAVELNGGTINGQVTSVSEKEATGYGEVTATSNEIAIPEGYKWVQTETGYELVVADSVAEVGGKKFESLEAAIAAAEAGDTVKLLKDIDLSATVAISKDVTVDLNGHDITATDARALWIKSGDVEITGSGTISAGGNGLGESSSVIRVGDGAANTDKAKLTVGKDVVVSTDRCYGITVFGRNDSDSDLATSDIELVLNGKVAVTGVNPAVSGNGNSFLSATTVTIGKDAVVTASQSYAIYHPDRGTLTVNGTVEGVGGIEIKSGKLVVGSSAKITATGTPSYPGVNNDGTSTSGYAIATVSNSGYTETPAAELNGGSITGTVTSIAENNAEEAGEVIATSDSVAIPEGYEWAKEGTKYVLKTPLELAKEAAIAEVNETDVDSFIETHQYKAHRLMEAAKNSAENANSIEEVDSVMTQFRADIAALTTLEEAKTEAKNELSFYKADVVFEDANARQPLVDAGIENIDKSTTADEINVALSEAKAAIDQLKTKEEADAENLAAIKEALKEALNDYNKDVVYRDAEKAAVRLAKAEGRDAIDAAATAEEATAAALAATQEIDAIKTDEDLKREEAKAALEAAKQEAIDKVNAVNKADYIEADQDDVEAAKSTALEAIGAEDATIESIEAAMTAFDTAIDECKLQAVADAEAAEELAEAKALAKTALADFNKDVVYRDAEKLAMREIKADGRESIDAATSIEDVAAALESAINEIKDLKTDEGYKLDESRAALSDLIADANAKAESDYTADSWSDANLADAIAAAEGVLNDPESSKDDYDAATAELQTALDKLVTAKAGAKKDLQDAVTAAEAILADGTEYTADSMKAVEDAIAEANAVLEDKEATTRQYNNAKKAVEDTVEALVKKADADAATEKAEAKAALTDLIADANAKAESDYTAESWADAKLADAIASAEAVLNDAESGKAEYDTAAEALQAALDKLVTTKAGAKKDLQDAVTAAEEKLADGTEYTADSKKAVEDAIAEANAVLEDKEATTRQYNNAKKAVEDAVEALVKQFDADAPAEINGTKYASLDAAITAAEAGDTVKLLKDIDLSATVVISKDVTIDLNGHDITATNTRALQIKNGNVEITGSGTISASGEALDASSSVIRVGDGATNANKAKLTVGKDVVVSTDKCYGITVFGRNDSDNDLTTSDIELVLNGKVAVTGENPAVSGNGNSFLSATTVTIGKDAVVTASQTYAIYHPDRGTLTVNGTVEGVGGIEIKSGKLVVGSSAKITATGTPEYAGPNNDGESTKGYAIASVANGGYTEIPAVELNGGTINGQVTSVSEKEATGYGEVTATSNEIAIPEGYKWVQTETGYELVVADSVAEVGGKKFESLDAAIAAAEAGDTVKLLKDIDLSSTVAISKDVTIDLNGHDITATDVRALWIKSGDVEITGSGMISASGAALGESSSVIRVGDGAANTDKAKLTVGKDVVVSTDRCYGITVFGRNDSDSDLTTSDIELVLNGKVAVTGTNPAVSGNGNSFLSATTVTIGKDAVVTASQTYAIYHPDRGTLTVNGTVEGVGGIEIKSGKLVVGNSADITATGTPEYAGPNNDGESTKGYAVASVANGGYTEIPAVELNGGTISGQVTSVSEVNAEGYGEVTATSDSVAIPEGYKWVKEGNHYALQTPLDVYKAEKVAELDAINVEDYIDAQQYKASRLIEKAKSDVANAGSIEEVDSIMDKLYEDLENLTTLAEEAKKALEDLVAEAKAKTEADYTAESWAYAKLADAIAAAEAVLADADADKTAYEEATAALQAALDKLVTTKAGAKKDLQDAVTAAESKLADGTEYTAESKKAVEDAIEEANAVLGDKEATTRQYNNAKKAVEDAVEALVKKADADAAAEKAEAKEALTDLIADANAKAESDYTAESWADANLADAIAAAEAVLADADADKTAYEEATAALQAALDKLVTTKAGAKKDLQDAVEAAEAKLADGTEYTAESKKAVEDAIEEANAVLGDKEATTRQYNNAKKAVEDAVEALVKKADADAAAIEEAKTAAKAELESYKDPADYSEANQETLAEAIEAGKTAIDEATTPAEAEAALAEAKATIDKIKNIKAEAKAGLEDSVAAAEAKLSDGTEYTADSKKAVEDAIAEANAVLEDKEATTRQYNNARKAVEDAVEALVKQSDADAAAEKAEAKAALTDLIADANAKAESDYTAESWTDAKLVDAITTAEAVLNDPASSKDDYDSATAALQAALDKLVTTKAGAKNDLAAAVEEANQLTEADYTAETWAALAAAVKEANEVLNDDEATKRQYVNARKAVENAVEALVKKSDADSEKELNDAKDAANKALDSVDTSKYSGAEKTAVEKAIADGKNAIAEAKTVDEVNAAKKAALDTIAAQKTNDEKAAEKALADAKDAANKALDSVDTSKYSGAEKTAVEKAIADGKNAIAEAKTVDEVNAAKKAALDTIAAQKTDEQKAKEEAEKPQPGTDGTAVGPGASEATADKAITTAASDEGPKGTKFAPLKLRSTKQTTKTITLRWTKTKKAVKYVVYGNMRGKKMKKLKTTTSNKLTVKKAGKKLKKGKCYKFMVVALDKNNKVVYTSKVAHVATKGGEYCNYKSITTKAQNNKVSLSKGKTFRLRAKTIKQDTSLKVRKCRAIKFVSSNKKIASVSTKGVIKANSKGKCTIYVYAQNGIFKKIKVTVN